jgi:hypothetical protein
MIFVLMLYFFLISAFSFSVRCFPNVPLVSFDLAFCPPTATTLPSRDAAACSQALVPGSTFAFFSPVLHDSASMRADTAGTIT